MSIEQHDFKTKASVLLTDDNIFCVGYPRFVYNIVDPEPILKRYGGWDLVKINTSLELSQFIAELNGEVWGQRIVINPDGKLITGPGTSINNHFDMSDQVLTGGNLVIDQYGPGCKFIPEKDRVITFSNVDGSHSPSADSILITTFLLVGYAKINMAIVPRVHPPEKEAELTKWVDFIKKSFSPLEARIAYKLRLAEYPELIPAVASALHQLTATQRKIATNIENIIINAMLNSSLVVTAHQQYLHKHFAKHFAFKSDQAVNVKTIDRYERAFFAPIVKYNDSISKLKAIRRDSKAASKPKTEPTLEKSQRAKL